jgi:two-component sensor histidine kinase
MSKDATIREIHHRVKNNLQTVAALLRLQSRRLANPEARTALEESMRRVSSIALVHETLSSAIDEEVDFD